MVLWFIELMMHPKLFDRFNCESKNEDNGRRRNWGVFLGL
jgi:hypothetical protein